NPPPGDLFYQVEVVNPSPCDASNVAKALRSNVAASKYVGIFEQQKNSFVFSVYPNPANNLLTVNLENVNNQNLSLTIYNAIGAVVKTMDIQQNQQQIDVSNLSNGLYMIELKSTNGYAVQKLAIDK
ncbi:MAG TPA: T9SS type A sorting domain-containing protein, partial [Bacteroidia bacterium]|nr:T9SS type A sorting domain-containing protein [Bacteroidia bacterium]